MALFGNLFKKKECAICGGEIGLLGNRKLEDGNMCKKCANKLSPWFEDRRHTTVAEINKQLEYRAQNMQELQGFHPTIALGEYNKVLVEERDGAPYRFIVSSDDNWLEDNPDIILISNVTDCSFDVQKFERELTYRDKDGEEQSYFPQRYEYNYDFFVEMKISNSPYFDDIRFKLNRSTVEIQSEKMGNSIFRMNAHDHTYHPRYRVYQQMFEDIQQVMGNGKIAAAQKAASSAPQPEAPVAKPKFCSNCGAPATGRFCENCGTKLF